MRYTVRPIGPEEVESFLRVGEVIRQQSGGESGVIYAPYSATDPPAPTSPERVTERRERLARPLTEPRWWRAFGGFAGAELVGQVAVDGGRLASEKHRGTIGMGIVEGHRGRGLGEQMLSSVIVWARSTATIDWLDLGVFSQNRRALALYTRLGFVEVGRVADRFRVDGKKITDIEMTLALRVLLRP